MCLLLICAKKMFDFVVGIPIEDENNQKAVFAVHTPLLFSIV